MRAFATLLALSALLLNGGCLLTGRVATSSELIRRHEPEVLTATSSSADEAGAPFAVAALEAECRVTPGDPEGGPGPRSYKLVRAREPSPDEKRFLDGLGLSFVGAYRSATDDAPEHEVPAGFPQRVLLGETVDQDGRLFLETPGGWRPLVLNRYIHRERSEGNPGLSYLELGLLPIAIALDLVTWPIQWFFIAPWFPLTPP
jgi:hypothetical protein